MRGPDRCPSCGDTSTGNRRTWAMVGGGRRKAMRLVRKGKAVIDGTNKVGRGTTLDDNTRPTHLRASYIVRNRTYVKCLDDWHRAPYPKCNLQCTTRGDIPHWHEGGPGRVVCDGECYNHRYDPTNPYDSPEGYDDDHYHDRMDLPRRHDPTKRAERDLRHRLRQGKDKR